jgi:FdhD protein
MTQMGHAVAQQLGLCAIGRATNRRFVCYSGADRLLLQPELAVAQPVAPAARG